MALSEDERKTRRAALNRRAYEKRKLHPLYAERERERSRRRRATKELRAARNAAERRRAAEQPEKHQARRDARKPYTHEYGRQRYLKKRAAGTSAEHGVPRDVAAAELSMQGGVCAICKKPVSMDQSRGRGAAHIDHDHLTGRFRGVLCTFCNPGLGWFKDDPALLEAAVAYLRSR